MNELWKGESKTRYFVCCLIDITNEFELNKLPKAWYHRSGKQQTAHVNLNHTLLENISDLMSITNRP